MYSGPGDWVSLLALERKPQSCEHARQDRLRPAAIKAGVALAPGMRFGFHNLRHSLATFGQRGY